MHLLNNTLKNDLVAYWKLDETISSSNTLPDAIGSHQMAVKNVSQITGKVGKALRITYQAISTFSGMRVDRNADLEFTGDFTIQAWIKLYNLSVVNQFILEKGGVDVIGYSLLYGTLGSASGICFRIGKGLPVPIVLGSDSFVPNTLEPSQWIHVLAWWKQSDGSLHLRLNHGTIGHLVTGGSLQHDPTEPIDFGQYDITTGSAVGTDIELDEIAIWNRLLTSQEQDFLWNDGDGQSIPLGALVPCKETVCCEDDPFAFQSHIGSGGGFDSECDPAPTVMFEPPYDTQVMFPTLVILRASREGATIRYTTDGSNPTLESTLYTTPISVDSPGTVIKARAWLSNCPDGPVNSATYRLWPSATNFTYACDTPDKVGRWNVWIPNGIGDYHWQLDITFASITSIKRFEVLELDSSGEFTTGSAWSTAEFINPFVDEPTKQLRVFPLALFIAAVQQNAAYTNDYSGTFGTFAAANHVIDFYGQGEFPTTGHFFKFRIIFADNTTLEKIVDTTCDAIPPALCPVPAAPTLTAFCTSIDVTFTLPIGDSLRIFKGNSPTGPWTQVNLTITGSPQTVADTGLANGVTRYYYLAHKPAAGSCPFTSGPVASATTLPLPTVSIGANPTAVCAGSSVTLTWDSANVTGTVTITDLAPQPGNAPGSASVTPSAPGQTYTITGTNSCGTAMASIAVIADAPATCGAPFSSTYERVRIQGYFDEFFPFDDPPCSTLGGSNSPAWGGQFRNTNLAACTWEIQDASNRSINDGHQVHSGLIELTGGNWRLSLFGSISGGGSELIWRGQKTCGSNPIGIYSRTAGCYTGVSSLTIELVT